MNPQTARLRSLVALAALSLSLLPATASAQSPSEDGYVTDGPAVQNQVESGTPAGQDEPGAPAGQDAPGSNPSPPSENGGGEKASLPFTGLDLGLLAGAGVLLFGLGTAVRLVLRLPPAVR